jgi:hypothetical protein
MQLSVVSPILVLYVSVLFCSATQIANTSASDLTHHLIPRGQTFGKYVDRVNPLAYKGLYLPVGPFFMKTPSLIGNNPQLEPVCKTTEALNWRCPALCQCGEDGYVDCDTVQFFHGSETPLAGSLRPLTGSRRALNRNRQSEAQETLLHICSNQCSCGHLEPAPTKPWRTTLIRHNSPTMKRLRAEYEAAMKARRTPKGRRPLFQEPPMDDSAHQLF